MDSDPQKNSFLQGEAAAEEKKHSLLLIVIITSSLSSDVNIVFDSQHVKRKRVTSLSTSSIPATYGQQPGER